MLDLTGETEKENLKELVLLRKLVNEKGKSNSGLRGIWYTQEQEAEHETDYPIIRSFTKVDIDHFLK